LNACRQRVENYRLPKAESQRTALAQQIGADGLQLLHALQQPDAPAELKEVGSRHLWQQVWQQYYDLSGGKANWRAGPRASADDQIIRSPYDPQAQTGKKRDLTWLGYKVHFTETCAQQESEQEQAMPIPQLIVQVQTTVAPVQDVERTAPIQEELAKRDLVPQEHIVDTGYVDAELLIRSQQQHGITLVGPALADNSWQAKAGKGFDLAHFQIDWHNQQAICPQSQISSSFRVAGERMAVVFASQVCAGCPVRSDCTQSQTTGRVLHLRPQAAHEALHARRQEQQTQAVWQQYATRAGIEGTHSQAVRRMGLRRARYDGLDKTHVQHVLSAVAINLVRMDAVLTQTPRGTTRRSNFARLALHPRLQVQAAA
jgi:transposase